MTNQLRPEFRPTIENEAHSAYSFEKMIARYVDEWGRIPHNIQNNAVRIVSRDGSVRRRGRRMAAKYPGKDSATGQSFQEGTEIIFATGLAVLAEPTKKEWMK